MESAFPRYLSAEEVAELFRVSTKHIHRMCRSGELPHIRVGKLIRLPEAGVREWLERGGTQQAASTQGDTMPT